MTVTLGGDSVLWSTQGEVAHVINTLNRIFREHLFSLDTQPFSGSHILLRWDGAARLFTGRHTADTRRHPHSHIVNCWGPD